ncbi:unnamed protein product [Caenorhabditis angaria]|uniref:SWI/SNF-related matrix-associated actin-dependent regulator of chromatin subfamily A-like protein 1 n=1 Tax=Caenorhabditis angaria TaxID=860376 RepID=A0A9P1IKT4_9PELO|nr:unnamed protein product [Caenorhabditis angaria]
MVLTDEQRARIAKNREEALRRAALYKENQMKQSQPSTSSTSSSSVSTHSSAPIPRPPPQPSQTSNQNVPSQPPLKIPPKTAPIFAPRTNNFQQKQLSKQQEAMINYIQKPVENRSKNPNIDVKLKCWTGNRIKIEFYPFHSAIVEAIKNVPSRSWDPNLKIWSCTFEDIKKLTECLKTVKVANVNIETIPLNVLHLLDFKPKPAPFDLSQVMDPELIKKLFGYQKDGIRFALERDGRILLADEMGLGKSVQALTIARYYKSDWPLVIICPASVKGSWKKQINTFFPIIHRIFIIDKGTDALPDVRTSNTVLIMSYEQMVLKHEFLKKQRYLTYIFDESHMLKDSKARRTKVATELSKIALHVVLLSGTPALSRPAELFTQIRIIDSKLFTNFQDFALRYCDGKQGRFGLEAKGCSNSEELAAIMFKRLMIRRLKCDVLKDLPEKRREVVYISGPTIESRMEDLQKAKAAYDSINSSDFGNRSHDCLLEYYNLTGIVKAAAVCEHILENYFYTDAPPRKVLIFAHHQIVLDTIQNEVMKRKLKAIRIDGKTPSSVRTGLCDSFQNDDEVRVAILSLTAAGIGITLTAASVVVFAEIHFNPGILVQAEDRAHRVGQKDSVFVQYLIAKKTSDDVMWNMVQQKLDVLGQVNLSSDTFRTADKTHLRFTDVNQPSVAEYFEKTPDTSFTGEVGEWKDPISENKEENEIEEDDDDDIIEIGPSAKRGKF